MSHSADTIAAISTPSGPGAIGILRLSGPRAVRIAQACFKPLGRKALADYPVRFLVYGDLLDSGGQPIDRCLCTYSRGPASYTGEEALTFAHIDWSDLRTLSLDPHPTPAGHQVMAQTHIPLLEDRLVEIRTAWLKTDLPERQEESRASLLRRLLPPMALLAAVFLLWALLPRRRHI